MTPDSPINLEFLPDWARQPSQKAPLSPREEKPIHARKGRPSFKAKGERRSRMHEAPRPATPVAEVKLDVTLLPEPRALLSVSEQIRGSALTYPLFSLAKMFLEKPERHLFRLRSIDDKPASLLFQCNHCGIPAVDENGIVTHILKKHCELFYEQEQIKGDPPKGNFTTVAQCKLDGTLLGPTNHHEYQANLMHLYKMKFRHLSFDQFKNNIVSIHDPTVVNKWKEEASQKSTYKCLQVPEPKTLNSYEEMERHFRECHIKSAVRHDQQLTLEGEVGHQLEDPRLVSILRSTWEKEMHFPAKLASYLREEFFKMGLHVFKGKKGMQFVSIARPRPLTADQTSISKTILAILDYIKQNPMKDRKSLLAALDGNSASSAEPDSSHATAVLTDLHWLVRQGHVIEYHNGMLEAARAPQKPTAPAKPAPVPSV